MERILIAAYAENYCIGLQNNLPWRLREDLRHFKQCTQGHFLILGRKTFESFPQPLPQRRHLIVSKQPGYQVAAPACQVLPSLEAAWQAAEQLAAEKVFVIGGGEIYRQVLAQGQVERLILTEVKTSVSGDTFFPIIDFSQWQEQSRRSFLKDAHNDFDFDIVEWIKK